MIAIREVSPEHEMTAARAMRALVLEAWPDVAGSLGRRLACAVAGR